MKFPRPSRLSRVPLLLLALLGGALLPACSGGSGGNDGFVVSSTTQAVDPSAPLLVVGNYLVYLASEALVGGATDLNNDGDTVDRVAVVVQIAQRTERVLGVAAVNCLVLANEVYLVVDEAEDDDALDTKNWDGDPGTDNLVLLHWSVADDAVTYVDTLDPNSTAVGALTAGGNLYYASADVLSGPDDTTLRRIDPADPLVPIPVDHQAGGGQLHPTLLGEDDDMVFLRLDETVEGVDLNGDTDTGDTCVLALLNGDSPADAIKSTELALAGVEAPFAARSYATNEWLVAFLVNEDAQGQTSLNPPSLGGQAIVPDSCLGTPDTDFDDDVLHFLDYGEFLTGASGGVNTGLAGRDRVLVVDGYVATLSWESDANCNLNEDADPFPGSDAVLRWREAVPSGIAPRGADQLRAVEQNLPGGAHGVSSLRDRFVAVIDELRDGEDQDGKAPNHDLVAWLNPAQANPDPTWTFYHLGANDSVGTGVVGEPYAGASWLAPEENLGRLAVTYQESMPPIDLNNWTPTCEPLNKDNDTQDEFPIWLDFEGEVLDFDGVPLAVVGDNPGIVFARGFAFFRISESEDNVDYNADQDKSDVILMRHPLAGSCAGVAMGTAHPQDGPVIITDGVSGAAFLTSENMAGVDFNGDQDMNDTVVRYFQF